MARIADKHGLTNGYRPTGLKRVVKRGRPRKYLFGAPSRKRRSYRRSTYTKSRVNASTPTTATIVFLLACWLILSVLVPAARCLIPIIVGTCTMLIIEGKCKKAWGLPNGRWSQPVSVGWIILTTFAMLIGFVIVILMQLANISVIPIIALTLLYVWLSVLILRRKYNKIKALNENQTGKSNAKCSANKEKCIRIDNVDIDVSSGERYGIIFDNFGIVMDEDDSDQLVLLFDVISKNGGAACCDLDIVCNLYANERKIATERETVFQDDFYGKDSMSIYFYKKNIAKTTTRIELYCKKL